MKKLTLILSLMLFFALLIGGCTDKKEPQSSSETSYTESVQLEYFTDDEGVVHKISDIDFAEPSYPTSWTSVTGLPEGFPALTERVSSFTSLAGTVNIKWNIFSTDMLKNTKESLEQWAGASLTETTGENITTYKLEKTDGDYTYTVDLIYQPYADGKTNSETSESFSQGEMYIYKQKTTSLTSQAQ